MATLNIPDAKVTVFEENFLTDWKQRNIAAIDEQLGRDDLNEQQRNQLLQARNEVENKTWRAMVFDLTRLGARTMKQNWAREDATKQAKLDIAAAEAAALAELDDF